MLIRRSRSASKWQSAAAGENRSANVRSDFGGVVQRVTVFVHVTEHLAQHALINEVLLTTKLLQDPEQNRLKTENPPCRSSAFSFTTCRFVKV
jgi:hypothetical protein